MTVLASLRVGDGRSGAVFRHERFFGRHHRSVVAQNAIASAMLRLERHRLGPRVFVFGRRIHEWHLGVLVIASGRRRARWEDRRRAGAVASLLGAWLIVKDWPDLTRSGRDTAGWRLGLHRRPLPLRPFRHLDDVPAVAAIATAAVGLVDLLSAVTPNISWRGRELVHLEPVSRDAERARACRPGLGRARRTAYYLYRRRTRRAPARGRRCCSP